eukprot:6204435-Pleurochrysis_carterae.AAC.1
MDGRSSVSLSRLSSRLTSRLFSLLLRLLSVLSRALFRVASQERATVSRQLSKFLLPGPLAYAARTDSFYTFNSYLEARCARAYVCETRGLARLSKRPRWCGLARAAMLDAPLSFEIARAHTHSSHAFACVYQDSCACPCICALGSTVHALWVDTSGVRPCCAGVAFRFRDVRRLRYAHLKGALLVVAAVLLSLVYFIPCLLVALRSAHPPL